MLTYLDGVVLNKVWNYLVEFLPAKLAPNLITLLGFLMTFVPACLILAYDPTFISEDFSKIFYYSCSVSIILYQALDALDGKQARKTGTSSVLGELFDHGLDAITSLAIMMIVAQCMNLGTLGNWGVIVFLLSSMNVFQMFTLEKRFTRVLRTGVGEFGVIESHYVCSLVFFLTGYYGNSMWSAPFSVFGYELAFNKFIYIFGIILAPMSLLNTVPLMIEGAKKYKEEALLKSYLTPVILNVLSFVFVVFFCDVAIKSPSTTVVLFSGPMVSFCWKYIISSVMKFNFNPLTWNSLLPLFALAACIGLECAGMSEIAEKLYLGAAILVWLYNLHFALFTVNQIANHLGIQVFFIKDKKAKK